ncbi:heterogeneous nuclear ribonucleoprotein 1-like [Iris pallida]|uniref:Heterogeneous nuclear ribonucleoprotein 1-like n=1 Tax=Iris pallida TaxID=29817 RepID=A0AAX6FE09_IRIPA|nr:heterogeneous nuclear ribonucleoprotein 1-like [Iris pallida]KAJ6814690.1 heterogeneous nuclear ribonucleoprotein 1-like [Iris pallida]
MESDLGKLFIGGISWDTNEDRLREYFQGFGEVVEAVIMKDRTTGRARGFGFVVFTDPAVAERVVMEKHLIDGRMVEAKKAVPRDDQHVVNRNPGSSGHGSPGQARTKKIFVGGLASTVTDADFKKYFEQFGTVTDVVVMYDHNTQRPRGFGFITYESEDSVDRVLLKTFHELNNKMVEVKRAVPKELSPGPIARSPVGGYSYGMNRLNSFLNGYTQGYSPSSVGGYGMRMDGRFGPLGSGGQTGFTSFNPGYGLGVNFEPGMNPSYGGNSNINSSLSYGRALSPYYSGNSNRFSSPIGYGGGNGSPGTVFSSPARNLWGNGGLNYTTNSASSNSYLASGSGGLGGFPSSGLNWGVSSPPISAQGVGSGSSYANAGLGYGSNENSFGLGATTYGRNNAAPGSLNTSFNALSNVYEGNYSDTYGGNSIYGDPTWRSASPDLEGSSPFEYGLGSAASDGIAKSSSGYIGGYNVTNRQTNGGIAA